MSGALRFNEGKPSLAYILQFVNPMRAIARIMEFGAAKYEDGNWRKGGKPDGEYLDSMMRHLTYWLHGEVYDDDSGCSHLGHAIWNLLALHELNHPDEIMDKEVFDKQCAYWKDVKEAGKKAEKTLAEMDAEGPWSSSNGGVKVMTEADLNALPTAKPRRTAGPRKWPKDNEYRTLSAVGSKGESPTIDKMGEIIRDGLLTDPSAREWINALKRINDGKYPTTEELAKAHQCEIPAEYCDDSPPLQENTVIGEIEPAVWQVEEVQKARDARTAALSAARTIGKRLREEIKRPKKTACSDEGACEACSVEDDCQRAETSTLTFPLKDLAKRGTLVDLERGYIYPATEELAKTADGEWQKAHSEYFQQLAKEHGE